MKSSIGLGEPPRSICTNSENFRCSQVGVFWDFGAKKEPRTRLGSWSAG